jgi:hypothetical protein
VVPDAGVYRWNIVADNGRILAASTESFATGRDAERAARDARDLVAGAAPPTDVPSKSIDRARRHVTLRPDGRWQVQAEGTTRAASTHATQADAERSAKRQARKTAGRGEWSCMGATGTFAARMWWDTANRSTACFACRLPSLATYLWSE